MATDNATYERIAPFYDLLDLPFEYLRYRRIRPLLWAGLSGRLLDAGVGTGRNIPFYPRDAVVTGIDNSPAMLARAAARARRLGASVTLRLEDATAPDLPEAAFDAAVATFLFCVLPPASQLPALRALARLVRPGGEVRLLEYVLPRDPRRRFIASLWAPWMRWAYGAGFDRATEQYFPASGLVRRRSEYVVPDLLMRHDLMRP